MVTPAVPPLAALFLSEGEEIMASIDPKRLDTVRFKTLVWGLFLTIVQNHDTLRSLKFSPSYQLTFNFLVAKPHHGVKLPFFENHVRSSYSIYGPITSVRLTLVARIHPAIHETSGASSYDQSVVSDPLLFRFDSSYYVQFNTPSPQPISASRLSQQRMEHRKSSELWPRT